MAVQALAQHEAGVLHGLLDGGLHLVGHLPGALAAHLQVAPAIAEAQPGFGLTHREGLKALAHEVGALKNWPVPLAWVVTCVFPPRTQPCTFLMSFTRSFVAIEVRPAGGPFPGDLSSPYRGRTLSWSLCRPWRCKSQWPWPLQNEWHDA